MMIMMMMMMMIGDGKPHKSAGYDVTSSLLLVDCVNLQLIIAQKCVKRVRSAKSLIIWPVFNIDSPNFTPMSLSI